MNFEIYIQNRNYQAPLEINYNDWFVTIEDEVSFPLRLVETYQIQKFEKELLPIMNLPF